MFTLEMPLKPAEVKISKSHQAYQAEEHGKWQNAQSAVHGHF